MKTSPTRHRPVLPALVTAALLTGAVWAAPAWGGNREMVEERTEELEEVNRQAVSQIPEDLPEEGLIDIRADVVGKGAASDVDITGYSIRRGQVTRKGQPRIGQEAEKANGSVPRHGPEKQ